MVDLILHSVFGEIAILLSLAAAIGFAGLMATAHDRKLHCGRIAGRTVGFRRLVRIQRCIDRIN